MRDLVGALLPSDVDDLLEARVDGVVGENTASVAVSSGEPNLGVDVQSTVSSTWRPDSRGLVGLVVKDVILVNWALPCGACGGLCSTLVYSSNPGKVRKERTNLLGLTREVVDGLLGTRYTLFKVCVATVIGREDRELESTWVAEIDVELAVLAVLLGVDTWSNLSHILIKDEGHDLAVVGQNMAHGAIRTSSAAIGDTNNVNLVWVRSVAATVIWREISALFDATSWNATTGEVGEVQGASAWSSVTFNWLGGNSKGLGQESKNSCRLHLEMEQCVD